MFAHYGDVKQNGGIPTLRYVASRKLYYCACGMLVPQKLIDRPCSHGAGRVSSAAVSCPTRRRWVALLSLEHTYCVVKHALILVLLAEKLYTIPVL